MPDNCPHCTLNFTPEIGFYWGAMYVGYGISSGLVLISGATCVLYFELSLMLTFVIIAIIATLFMPINARLSRSIWLAAHAACPAENNTKKVK